MKKQAIERHWMRISCWATALLFLALPSLCSAGDLEYPRVVQADANGRFEVRIQISNAEHHGFEILEFINASYAEGGLWIRDLHDGNWEVVIIGKLTAWGEDGALVFRADPEGVFVEGEIAIIAYGNPIPTLTEWGMIIFCVLLFGWMTWMIVRRRRIVTIGQ